VSMPHVSEVKFDLPPSLGYIDPEVLHELGQKFPAEFGELYTNHEELEKVASDEFLEIVDPVTEAFSRYVHDKHGIQPDNIHYSYSTEPALPHKSQRGFVKWHIDGSPADKEVMLVSSALTTEILVSGGRSTIQYVGRGALRTILRPAMFEQEIIGAAIGTGLVAVHNPEPYDMTIMTNHLHRPAINTTDRDVPRVFLRAFATFQE